MARSPFLFYLQLVEVEEAFKNLKGDLAIRPIFHQLEKRIEAHIFVCFLAYCVQITLRHQLRAKAPGLTVRQIGKRRVGKEWRSGWGRVRSNEARLTCEWDCVLEHGSLCR